MRFYQGTHRFYAGIDLHTKSMYVCVLDQNTNSQYNLPPLPGRIAHKINRAGVAERFEEPAVRWNVTADLTLIEHYDALIRQLELYLARSAKVHDASTFYRLRSVPGIGKILSLVLMYEICDIGRFPRVQDFISYARLVKCSKESAGKKCGYGGRKIGNAHLKWAFSEATCLFMRESEKAKAFVAKKERKHGKGKAMSILAARLGRAVYTMLRRGESFDEERFFAGA